VLATPRHPARPSPPPRCPPARHPLRQPRTSSGSAAVNRGPPGAHHGAAGDPRPSKGVAKLPSHCSWLLLPWLAQSSAPSTGLLHAQPAAHFHIAPSARPVVLSSSLLLRPSSGPTAKQSCIQERTSAAAKGAKPTAHFRLSQVTSRHPLGECDLERLSWARIVPRETVEVVCW
jgi:hypothetical protein